MGKFLPGQSGNPAGRPKGRPDKRNLIFGERLRELGVDVVLELVAMLRQDNLDDSLRLKILETMCRYSYPALKAAELSLATEDNLGSVTDERLFAMLKETILSMDESRQDALFQALQE